MVPDIGFMIGFYILTRLLALERNKEGKVSSAARIFAAVSFIVTVIAMIDLFAKGSAASGL